MGVFDICVGEKVCWNVCKYVWNVKNVYWVGLPNGQMLKIYLSKNNIKLISSKVELIIVSYGVNYFSLSESMIFFYQHTHTYIFLSLLFDFFSFISFSFGCLLKVIITHWTHYDGDILLGLFRIQPASMKPAGTKLIRPLQRPTIGVRRGGQWWSRQTEDCRRDKQWLSCTLTKNHTALLYIYTHTL